MERTVGMLNMVTAINLLLAATCFEVSFGWLLSAVVRGAIGLAVFLYFGLALGQMVSVMERNPTVWSGMDA
ncbi:MAG TPA: hypothetical protein PKW75_04420 [candidate division Zixibacteria bacterium]|nr:hypothetical protein [candidate division Zixibacteria bacterium]MDD4918113.1 hypothetical protein [candidate division Zixibacteria bacterium]MDM7972012.1 hypothetical protein [candidate division Zixibacteria bacterium]HOZ07513.1 hypothetical protein [candidate division Zixibacteria bacterium]HPM37369.1 hypothetical protein [candidate division Zixibacteria bacterium]